MKTADRLIAERRAAVERELVAAAGDDSLCAVSKSGGEVDAVKYLEGRMAVLMQLGGVLRRHGDVATAIAEMLSDWSAQLTSVQERDAGRGWIAYRAGGVDELSGLTDLR